MKVQEAVASRVIAGGHFDGHLWGPFGALVCDVFSEYCFLSFFDMGAAARSHPPLLTPPSRQGRPNFRGRFSRQGVRQDFLFVRLIRGKFRGPITLLSIVETFAMLEGNGRRHQGK